GTENFLKSPAMIESEAFLAIERGIEIVKELSKEGVKIISTGEMGIGNTTTTTAVLSAFLEMDPDELTGRGAGLSDDGLNRKRRVIKEGLSKYSFDNITDPKKRAFEILRTLGGLDIAALSGAFIGGAIFHVPMVIDGVISATAALIAETLLPGTREYLIPSHKGREKGNALALNKLHLEPFINGNMALGEGTGAIMLFPVLDSVMYYYDHGAKFSDYQIDEYKRYEK
ncbi:MAG: nicotinate-nucleotide--dimethylbenzimidazole phosphoribosyltransferase, partial [Lachnospiraceae bacterium]|nr:nicotinate-nucleotide--dimethylbenzimidazole phosphoribosyltransferase [Lachnospiraceae bacterium]